MGFPSDLRETLITIGQVATEVACNVVGFREFVSIYAVRSQDILAFSVCFPYYSDCELIFRLVRFRVEAALIEADADVFGDQLAGLQQIYLPTEESVEFILEIWKVPISELRAANRTDIPV